MANRPEIPELVSGETDDRGMLTRLRVFLRSLIISCQ
jgi:hypothetical protein